MTARRPWAWPLAPLYAAGVAAKDALRAVRVLPTRKLSWPVVSVGSLSAGGAGKTPVVIALAELLQTHGWSVDVISRGYGRTHVDVARVDPDIEDAALRFGDEPVLIARRTRAPVWVGADRYAAGLAADASCAQPRKPHLHLLDDGFQHRSLARSLDIVVLTQEDLTDALLPAGNRREPLHALGRADAIILRDDERERVEPKVRRWVRPDAVVWTITRTLRLPPQSHVPLLAFCAIARPNGFKDMLRSAVFHVEQFVAFGDHHAYSPTDIARLVEAARACAAQGFVTTEKDAVKLTPQMLAQLNAVGPVHIAQLETKFMDEPAVLRDLEARLR